MHWCSPRGNFLALKLLKAVVNLFLACLGLIFHLPWLCLESPAALSTLAHRLVSGICNAEIMQSKQAAVRSTVQVHHVIIVTVKLTSRGAKMPIDNVKVLIKYLQGGPKIWHRFYRAMHFSAFARSWDRMSSVRPSVCNVGGLWSHRLEILETNCTNN